MRHLLTSNLGLQQAGLVDALGAPEVKRGRHALGANM